MPLFPEATGFVGECLMSVGIMPEDTITRHKLFELAIHVQGGFSSKKEQRVEFCGLLSGMLQNVPTEDDPTEVLWRRVTRMLVAYRKSVDTAQKHKDLNRPVALTPTPGINASASHLRL